MTAVFIKNKIVLEIEQKVKDQQEFISKGTLENMKDYGKACGMVLGLESALNTFVELFDKYVEVQEVYDD